MRSIGRPPETNHAAVAALVPGFCPLAKTPAVLPPLRDVAAAGQVADGVAAHAEKPRDAGDRPGSRKQLFRQADALRPSAAAIVVLLAAVDAAAEFADRLVAAADALGDHLVGEPLVARQEAQRMVDRRARQSPPAAIV